MRSPLLRLSPMLDSGFLRANTRLRHSEDLMKGIKFPIILPKKHPVNQLIFKYYHERKSHEMGVNYTLNHLRQQHHVIHSHQEVKQCSGKCYECKTFPNAFRYTADGTSSTFSLGDDLQTIYELCYRLRWTVLEYPRTGTSSNQEIIVPVPLLTNSLLSFRNGSVSRHSRFPKRFHKNGSETRQA